MATSARPVALITGASAGIGAALAREAANDGHDLVLVARRPEPMEALAAELKSTGAEITVITADLNKPGAAAELMKTVEQREATHRPRSDPAIIHPRFAAWYKLGLTG